MRYTGLLITLLMSFFYFTGCSHKEVKEAPAPVAPEIVPEAEPEPDYTDTMKAIYEKLVRSIKKRDMESILQCYTNDAVYGYSETQFLELTCFDGTLQTQGIENIEKQYAKMFQKRYLDSIEYEIMKADTLRKQLKVINVWANSDFGVYEYIDFELVDGRLGIKSHMIVRERKGVRG